MSCLDVLVYGWGALPPSTYARLLEQAGEIVVLGIFGQTEAITCHRFWPRRWPETYQATAPVVNYVGLPSPLLASDVFDDDGVSLRDRPGVPGEVVYRTPTVTAGYYKDEAATREAFRTGWFHSGDSAAFDADGLRVVVDRIKDIVKTGGENVSSLRVEAALYEHPGVARAAVIGLPHDRWGEAVTAVVVPAPGAEPTADELIAHCRERLGGYETPKAVVFTDGLPETVGGKVLKYRLRTRYADLYAVRRRPDVRIGVNVGHFIGSPPPDLAQRVQALDAAGFASLWFAEAYGSDVFTPLAFCAALTSRIRLGAAVAQLPARTPTATAMAATTLDHLSGGRVVLGLGASGPQVSEGWHGVPYARPLARTREYVEIVRRCSRARRRWRTRGSSSRCPRPGRSSASRCGRRCTRTAATCPCSSARRGRGTSRWPPRSPTAGTRCSSLRLSTRSTATRSTRASRAARAGAPPGSRWSRRCRW